MSCPLKLYGAVCYLYLNKTERKNIVYFNKQVSMLHKLNIQIKPNIATIFNVKALIEFEINSLAPAPIPLATPPSFQYSVDLGLCQVTGRTRQLGTGVSNQKAVWGGSPYQLHPVLSSS